MKLSLEEARKRATQTKLRVKEGTADIREAEGPRTIAFVFSTREGEEQVYNAALLVHAWNHFDNVVAALEKACLLVASLDDGIKLEDGAEQLTSLLVILKKAKTVEVP